MHNKRARRLRHGFDNEDARHDREIRKMSLEMRLVERTAL
jgi:hypothetical protein